MVWSGLQIQYQNKKNNVISKGKKIWDVNTVFSRKGIMEEPCSLYKFSLYFFVVFFWSFRDCAFLNHWGASLCVVREKTYILQIIVTWNIAPAFPFLLKSSYFKAKAENFNWIFCCFHFPFSSVQSLSHVQLFVTTWTAASQASLSIINSQFTQTHVHWISDAIQPCHPLSSPSPPAFNLYQHQGLFQWVSSLIQVAKVLGFQLQHQSFQWIFRTDFH